MFRPSVRLIASAAVTLSTAACGAPEVPDREAPSAVVWRAGPPLPAPVTNNVVGAVEVGGRTAVFSFLGMDSTKTAAGVTSAAWRWDVGDEGGWREIAPVPGAPRLAATGQVVRGRVYVLGGATLGPDGTPRAVGDVNVYDPASDTWSRGASMPVPVADAASGVWRDSLIVVVSGSRGSATVQDVQWYDPASDRWSRGTAIGGAAVFGHAGTVVGDQIVYVDGARRGEDGSTWVLEADPWTGRVDSAGTAVITWERPAAHPAPALFGAAAGTVGRLALFIGGTDRPYDDIGMGYDGTPAQPLRQVLAYAPAVGNWRNLAAPPLATMDHRTLGVAGSAVYVVGGIEEGGRVSNKTWYADVQTLLATIW